MHLPSPLLTLVKSTQPGGKQHGLTRLGPRHGPAPPTAAYMAPRRLSTGQGEVSEAHVRFAHRHIVARSLRCGFPPSGAARMVMPWMPASQPRFVTPLRS